MATLRNLVKQLKASGTEVKFFPRSDRGIIITKVGTQSFKGKEGNKYVRQLFGEKLSERQEEQLQRLTRENYKTFGYDVKTPTGEVIRKMAKTRRLEPLPEELQKELKKAQKMFRKYNPKDRTTIKTKSVRYILKKEGYERALHKIKEASKYAQGFAYIENLKALKKRLENDITIMEDEDTEPIDDIISDLDILIANDGLGFKDEDLMLFYGYVYDWENYKISSRTLLGHWNSIRGK